jgi:hypothetical protein
MKKLNSIKLNSAPKGEITLWDYEHPYGDKSEPVVVIGVSLKEGEMPEWKVHIPYANLDELIKKLQEIQAAC